MTSRTYTESNSHLWLWLFVSFVIHLVICVLLFVRFDSMQFKKGTSKDMRMKVAGFQILSGGEQGDSSPAQAPMLPISPKSPNASSPAPTTSPQIQQSNAFDLSSLSLYQGSSAGKGGTGSGKKAQNHNSKIKALGKFQSVDRIAQRDIEELYGAEFGDYGLAEQEFLVNHLRDIGRITQRYLQYPPSALRLGQEGLSAVEFYLHPNGDISGLKIIVSSNYMLLDRNSERTIEIAYKDYPRPTSKTKIRIFVSYGISYYIY